MIMHIQLLILSSYLHPKYVGYVVSFYYSIVIIEERKKQRFIMETNIILMCTYTY